MRTDRGAVSVLVALLVPMVLLGMGALVLDLGALYSEKRQLQNGADAAAIAVAKAYGGATPSTCVVGGRAALADQYADGNANDASGSNVDSLTCPAANRVKVTTSTASSGGSAIVPVLAQLLGAGPKTLHAQATATWGPPSRMTGLPVTFSACEFNAYTAGGTALAPPPPYPPYPTERVIKFHGQPDGSGCSTDMSGADLPGGFGWLQSSDGTCSTSTDQNGWAGDKTGSSVPSACSPAYFASLVGHVIDLPVYDGVNGLNGTNGQYHVKGYAAFYLTGYWLGGQYKAPSVVTGSNYCTGNDRCIYGFFTKDLQPVAATVGTGPSLGVTVVQLID